MDEQSVEAVSHAMLIAAQDAKLKQLQEENRMLKAALRQSRLDFLAMRDDRDL
jgi:hypothetical protein